jgi:hypothetical protein
MAEHRSALAVLDARHWTGRRTLGHTAGRVAGSWQKCFARTGAALARVGDTRDFTFVPTE